VRCGDGKLVAQRAEVELFDLSKDVSEASAPASTLPDKVAELTKLHDDWLASMAEPVKAGDKKWTRGMDAAKKNKLTPVEKKQARSETRVKH
jgi:hypothetical protein